MVKSKLKVAVNMAMGGAPMENEVVMIDLGNSMEGSPNLCMLNAVPRVLVSFGGNESAPLDGVGISSLVVPITHFFVLDPTTSDGVPSLTCGGTYSKALRPPGSSPSLNIISSLVFSFSFMDLDEGSFLVE